MKLNELKDTPIEKDISIRWVTEGEVVDEPCIEEMFVDSVNLVNEMADQLLVMREYLKKRCKSKLARNMVADAGSLATDAQIFVEKAYGQDR
jgi:hypothetical protein